MTELNLGAMKDDGLLDAREVAKILQVHPRTVLRLITEQQELPAIRVGGRWRVQQSDLLKYIRTHRQGGDVNAESKSFSISTNPSASEGVNEVQMRILTDSETSIGKEEILPSQGAELEGRAGLQKIPFDDALLTAPPRFVGRTMELDRLMDRLRMGGMIGITALRGMAGVGKTALAAVALRKLRKEGCFHDGIAVVLCQNFSEASALLRHVLARFDLQYREPETSDFVDLAETAYQLLNGKDALVVLDNIEPRLEIEKVVAPLRAAGITLLLTARQILPHTVVPVDAVITLGLLSKEEALDLFAHSLGLSNATQFSTAERVASELIVKVLDRHTLAVRLAGAYAADLHRDLEVLAHELENPQRAFELPEGEMPQAVKWVFTQSTEALPPEAKKLFVALAIFTSIDFSRNAVIKLARELHLSMPETHTNLLVLRGLVNPSVNTSMPRGSDRERLSLHPLLRALATSEFVTWSEEERNATWHILAGYYADYAKGLSDADLNPDEIGAALGPDEMNITRTLEWAHAHMQNKLVVAICSGMQYLWSDRYHTQAILDYLPWGIEAAETIGKETDQGADPLQIAKLALSYGKVLQLTNKIDGTQGRGGLDEARNYYEKSLAIARAVEDPQCQGIALYCLGRLARQFGDLDQAESLYEQALPILRHVQNRRDEGLTLAFLGQIRYNRGDLKEAKHFYEEALSICRKVRYQSGEGWILGYLGQLAIAYGRLDEAEHYYRPYLAIANELQDQRSMGVCLSFLGEIALERGQYDEAENSLQKALDFLSTVQDPQSEGWALYLLGRVALACERYEEARGLLEESLTLLQKAKNLRGESLVLLRLAFLTEVKGDLDLCEELYRKSLTICSRLQDRQVAADVRLELGRFLIEKRLNYTEGCSMLIEARRYYVEMELPKEERARKVALQLSCEG